MNVLGVEGQTLTDLAAVTSVTSPEAERGSEKKRMKTIGVAKVHQGEDPTLGLRVPARGGPSEETSSDVNVFVELSKCSNSEIKVQSFNNYFSK